MIGTLFLAVILRDLSERSGGQSRNFFVRQGLPAVSGSPSCPRLQVPDPGLMPTACTDGEDRFGAASPATGSNLENPVRRTSAPGGQDLSSAVLPAFVKRKVQDGRSQPAVSGCEAGPPTGKSLQWIERLRKSW